MKRLGWLVLLLLIPLLGGCTPVLKHLKWEEIPTYNPPPIEDVVAHPPAELLAGEVAPWDGVLLHPDDLNALLSEHQRLLYSLGLCYTGRGEDREYADTALSSCQDAVTVCRKNLPRAFLAGAGAGAAACGITVGIVAGATN